MIDSDDLTSARRIGDQLGRAGGTIHRWAEQGLIHRFDVGDGLVVYLRSEVVAVSATAPALRVPIVEAAAS